jgi:hypothetical protein
MAPDDGFPVKDVWKTFYVFAATGTDHKYRQHYVAS